MRRIFLSFLGTNDYLPCTYYRGEDGFESQHVRFVQEATVRLSCSDWDERDRILIFTTADAYEKNWVDNGQINHKTNERLIRKGLKECLSKVGLGCSLERVEIPDGKSEAEIWEIFSGVFNSLKHGDEVTFDITHAFRSIPMLAIVVLNYAKVIKNITLSAVYYGAFEVLGSQREAEDMPLEKRRVPIYDLTAFDQLLDWSVAIDRFVGAGDAGLVYTLARGGLKKILTETKGKDKNAAAIRDVGRTLESFCQALSTCRGTEIGPIAAKLKSEMEQCEDTDVLPPFKPLFRQLRKGIEPFEGEEISDGIAAAQWCLEHNLIQQSATIIREVVINYLLSALEKDEGDVFERQIAGKAISSAFSNTLNKEKEETEKDIKGLIEPYLQFCDKKPQLVQLWGQLAPLRNDLNHAGYVKDRRNFSVFANRLPGLIEKLRDEMKQPNDVK